MLDSSQRLFYKTMGTNGVQGNVAYTLIRPTAICITHMCTCLFAYPHSNVEPENVTWPVRWFPFIPLWFSCIVLLFIPRALADVYRKRRDSTGAVTIQDYTQKATLHWVLRYIVLVSNVVAVGNLSHCNPSRIMKNV